MNYNQCIKELMVGSYSKETYRCQRQNGYGPGGLYCRAHANMMATDEEKLRMVMGDKLIKKEEPK